MTMLRKDFLLGTLVTAGAALIGCGDDSSSGGNGGTGGSGGESSGGSPATGGSASGGAPGTGGSGGGAGPACSSEIGLNHGHVIEVSQADIDAGVDKTYDIMGSSVHTHTVTVTAADFTTLAANGSVTITSSEGSAHTHDVTVTCA